MINIWVTFAACDVRVKSKRPAVRTTDLFISLYAYLPGTRLSSHDLLNLELRHHQKLAVRVIMCIYVVRISAANVQTFGVTAKHFATFLCFHLSK